MLCNIVNGNLFRIIQRYVKVMRYAVISDIHSNLEAFQAVLRKCADLAVDSYLCLGDLIGYNANPHECIELARSLPISGIVKGNHDEFVVNYGTDLSLFNENAQAAVLWTREHITDSDWNFLDSLDMRYSNFSDDITIVHASLNYPAAWNYVFEKFHADCHFAFQRTNVCFCGHSHVPIAFRQCIRNGSVVIEEIPSWVRQTSEDPLSFQLNYEEAFCVTIDKSSKYLFNVGSIGQPRNRDPRASFAVIDTNERSVTRYCVTYPIQIVQEKIL